MLRKIERLIKYFSMEDKKSCLCCFPLLLIIQSNFARQLLHENCANAGNGTEAKNGEKKYGSAVTQALLLDTTLIGFWIIDVPPPRHPGENATLAHLQDCFKEEGQPWGFLWEVKHGFR